MGELKLRFKNFNIFYSYLEGNVDFFYLYYLF